MDATAVDRGKRFTLRRFKLQVVVVMKDYAMESKWRAIRDNLRNFFLSPPAEMLSFLQQFKSVSM
jgi:hypothetical protein